MPKKLTSEEKEAFKEKMAKARGVKPKPKKSELKEEEDKKEIEDTGIYPKVEIGMWKKNGERLGKLVDTAFKQKHGKTNPN